MIRAILFDLDDTLIDRAEAHRLYCVDFMARFPGVFPRDRRDADLQILEDSGRDRRRFARAVISRFPAVGLGPAEVSADHASRLATFVRPDPSIARLLAALARRYRIAIVSNGSGKVQRSKIARLGGSPPKAFISGEIGVAKPRPALFQRAIDWTGSASHETLFVGDDPVCDIAGASAVGMVTCWIAAGRSYPIGPPTPDLTINRVEELARALA